MFVLYLSKAGVLSCVLLNQMYVGLDYFSALSCSVYMCLVVYAYIKYTHKTKIYIDILTQLLLLQHSLL